MPQLMEHPCHGRPDCLTLPRVLPHLRVHVHDYGQDHVQHEQHEEQHEGPDPDARSEWVLLRERRPIILALHQHPEADAHGPLQRRKLLQPAAKDEAAGDGVSHERRHQHEEEVHNVDNAGLQRASDNAKPRLRPEGCEEAEQEDQVVLCYHDSKPAREKLHAICLIMKLYAEGVELSGHISHLGVDDFPEPIQHAPPHRVLYKIAKHAKPSKCNHQPLQDGSILLAHPAKAPLLDGLPNSQHLCNGGEEQHHQPQYIGAYCGRVGPHEQEERLEGESGKDATSPAEEEVHVHLLEPRPAHFCVEQQRLDNHLLGLRVQPAPLMEVIHVLLDEAVVRVGIQEGLEGVPLHWAA
mmetsp:Transcript_48061/g.153391  ORF Transcript_48061/g.153391 Transcript_48061/m.153391 type:complete len:353 (-) Transcript_48061:863-1921(-)